MIRSHDEPVVLTLVVEGPATMVESPAVSEATTERLRRGVRALRLDLRDCTALDSTFSGTLLSLKRQLEDVGGTLTLVSPSAKVIDLLRQMDLEDFYTIEIADRIGGLLTDVPTTRPNDERLSRLIVDAHEQLSRVPGAAGAAFRTVVEEMRRDETSSPSGNGPPTGAARSDDRHAAADTPKPPSRATSRA